MKEHPKVNSSSVAAALKQDNNTVSSVLSKMSIRGMLRVEEVAMRGRIGQGYGVRKVKHYSVTIPAYEMLPAPKDYKPQREKRGAKNQHVKPVVVPVAINTAVEPPEVAVQFAPPAPAKKTAKEIVEGMTIKEAKELYLELKEAFRMGY